MRDQVVSKGGAHATKLVWVVTLLGFGAGVILLGIVYWTMSEIRSERENFDQLQVDMTRMVTSLDPLLARGRDAMGALLTSDDRATPDSRWITDVASLIQDYRGRGVVDNAGMSQVLDMLDNQLLSVREIWDRCFNWNRLNTALVSNFPVAKKQIETAL